MTADDPSFVRQHRVLDRIVVPATAFLETLLAAAERVHGVATVTVEDVTLTTALVLDDDGTGRTVQTICAAPRDGGSAVSINSAPERGDESDVWVAHVTATVRAEAAPPASVSLDDARAQCQKLVPIETFYDGFVRRGLEFGPRFRSVRRVMRGNQQALAEVELSAELIADTTAFRIHPVLLDGCLQGVAAALDDEDDALYLPVCISQFAALRSAGGTCWSHVAIDKAGADSVRADIDVFDQAGALVATLRGVQLKRVGRHAFNSLGDRDLDALLYTVQWPVALLDQDASAPLEWSVPDLAEASARAAQELRTSAALDVYDRFLPQFEALCADYVIDTMRRLGWNPVAGESVNGRELAMRLRVTPAYARLFARLLAILGEVGVLSRTSRGWSVVRQLPPVDPARDLASLKSTCPPGADAELEMTGRVASQFADALRGNIEPMQLLFPNGSLDTAERLYRDAPTARFFNGLLAEMIATAAVTATSRRKLRILEVGAGTGGTTTRVAPLMPADRVEYTFTDVGPTFVARARSRFATFPFMRFEVLDLERPPDLQGFRDASFDLVIAANVIHATRDLRTTLERLRRLLAPGGMLVMLEVTAPQRWFDLTVGLTDGWWAFTDTNLRPNYATLSRQQWITLLAECGFENPVGLPEDTSRGGCVSLQSLLVARVSAALPPERGEREWLIFADRRGVGDALASELRRGGDRCTLVRAQPLESGDAVVAIDPGSAADYRRVLSHASAQRPGFDGVIHLWSLDDAPGSASMSALVSSEPQGAVSAMLLAQALVAESPAPRLWIVTSGAQQIDSRDRSLSPMQAGVWGIGKTLAIEHPELRCVCIDLEPDAELASVRALVAELREPGVEAHVAVRSASRHVARLVRSRSHVVADAPRPAVFRLMPEIGGSIERFGCAPIARRVPGAGEVEIAVAATGLNFKDVLNALGMYPGDPGPLGGECAGRVVAVGPGVTHVQVDDEVLAVAGGSFASHVIVKADLVHARPAGMGVEEGAAFPIAFLTAEFCLAHLARLRAGERVLIHAAAGGVGMAAVKLAQRAGAEVYATAGSAWKRDLLRSMGVKHVMDSRSTAFVETIAALTGGRGVDVVLNSLSGDIIEASFRVLADGGRFVEIGKRGIKDQAWVDALGRGHRYFIVDWGETAAQDPALIGGMLARLVDEVRTGALTPLPRHVFALSEAERAFRFMATAQHAGKIVVRHESSSGFDVRRDGTYLITGGLSGLGLEVARWLASRGAGRLVLVGRRTPSPSAEAIVASMRTSGTLVAVEAVDVSDQSALADMLVRVRREGPPLRGVVHSAGVLDDAAVIQQDSARFARVLAPKVRGACLLDSLTRIDPLDFFVLFSSAASVLGSAGQANHAAANAILDVLARERSNRGLPGLSINWGPWKDVGAAADRGIVDRLAAEGVAAITTTQGLAALDRTLSGVAPQVAVLSLDWDRFLQRSPIGRSPFFSEAARGVLAKASPVESRSSRQTDLRTQVSDATAARRPAIVEAFVREHALRVLGLDPARAIDPRAPLGDLGLDSLLAIELRNALARSLGVSLPATLLFDYPTITALTDFVMADVLELETTPAGAVIAAPPADLVGSIEDLPDDEVDRLLAARKKASVR